MDKLKTIIKEIRGNALWDIIKIVFGGALVSTGLHTLLLQLIYSVPFNWVVIMGLFIVAVLVIGIAHLLGKWAIQPKIQSEIATSELQPANATKSVLALVIFVIFALVSGFFIGRTTNNNKITSAEFWDTKSFVQVKNRTFINEKILLDGHEYIGCTFNNVTFTYNGTAAFSFSNNKINGTYRFSSENDKVISTFILINAMTQLNIRIVDDNGNPMNNIKSPEFLTK